MPQNRLTTRTSRAMRVAFLAGTSLSTGAAWAGGTPENALLLIDPASPESMYVGNYYKAARNIPDENVVYIYPGAGNYQQFVSITQAGVQGAIAGGAGRRTDDHIDYIVVTPGAPFYVSAPGLITDACSPVGRFSISSAYTESFNSAQLLAGSVPVTTPNTYYSVTAPQYFDSSLRYLGGGISTATGSRRYYIGAMLGHTGVAGNTVEQVLDTIDRSVAVDGTRPGGTFYFMQTTDAVRSGPRDGYYTTAVNTIVGLGGQAQRIQGIVPEGAQDCLGIMTGWAQWDLLGANIGIRPGAFCDHLTSWGATFDIADQTKITDWITKGASASAGTVEEPCNYPGKFPHARLHVHYFQGLSLGEAYLRSMAYYPLQSLFLGDPLTRPFTYIPSVTVPDAPSGTVSGVVRLSPVGTTGRPGAQVNSFELQIDGVSRGFTGPGGSFTVDTAALADGPHDARVLGFDNTTIKAAGRWTGTLRVNNRGRSTTVSAPVTSGHLNTPLTFTVASSGAGAPVREVRLLQNGRVVAAAQQGSATFTLYGQTLGAGPVRVQAETLYTDRRSSLSNPVTLNIAYSAPAPGGPAPAAFHYTKFVAPDQTTVVELPAAHNDSPSAATFTIVSPPSLFTLVPSTNAGFRVLRPPATSGWREDRFTYRVDTPSGQSSTATVVLLPSTCVIDIDGDGGASVSDFLAFLSLYAAGDGRADFTGDGTVNVQDFLAFLSAYSAGC
jgi:uncharacterized protein (TIGR03790 family)